MFVAGLVHLYTRDIEAASHFYGAQPHRAKLGRQGVAPARTTARSIRAVTSEGRSRSVSEFRNAVRGRLERMFAAVDRWGRATEAMRSGTSPDADAAARELQAAEDELLAAYHEIPRQGS